MSRLEVQPVVSCASRAHLTRSLTDRAPTARSMGDAPVTERAAGRRRPAMDRRRPDHRGPLAGAGRAPGAGLGPSEPPNSRSVASPGCRARAAWGRGLAGPTPAGGHRRLPSCRAHCVQPLRFELVHPGDGSARRGPAPPLAEVVRRAAGSPLLHRPGSARTSATSSPLAASQGTPSSARPSPFDALSIQQPSACSCVLGRAAVPSTSPASPCMGRGAWRRFVAGEVPSATGAQATPPHSMEVASGGPLVDRLAQVSSAASSEAYTRTETPETTSAWSPTCFRPRRGDHPHRGDDGHRRGGDTSFFGRA